MTRACRRLGGVNASAEAPATPKLGSDAGGAAAGPLKPGPEIYQSIGVEPIINCRGTFTIIGGSVERPEVRAAMDAASKSLRADRRTGGRGRTAARRADRSRVGHGVGRVRRGTEACHRCVRHGRQSRAADSHSRSDRFRQDRGRQPAVLPKRLRRRRPQHRREDDHGRHAGRTRERAGSADGDDLSHVRRRPLRPDPCRSRTWRGSRSRRTSRS